ncbi:MAG: AMP-binding protein [Comamonas sp.]
MALNQNAAAAASSATRASDLAGLLAQAPDDAIALEFAGTTLTYQQLRAQVLATAAGLQRQGLRPGDVLGIWLPNTPRWLVLHLACASLGVATLSLNLKLGIKELVSFIDRSGCKALAFDRGIANAFAIANGAPAAANLLLAGNSLAQVMEQHAGSLQLLIDATAGEPVSLPAGATGSSAVCTHWAALAPATRTTTPEKETAGATGTYASTTCIILSSSGTTSMPKLIVHTQSNVARHAQDAAPGFHVGADCCTLLALPMCGAFGYTAAMMTLAAGARLVLHETFDPVHAALTLQNQPITHMFGTNDMVDKLIAPLPADWRPLALRFFGHANFVPGLDELPGRAEQYGIPMVGCFGMSEILALFAHQAPGAALSRRAQSGGFPVSPGATVRVRNLETGGLAAAHEPGELEFFGPNMMQEYLRNPEATQQAFTEDGFLRSGDLGYLNGDGGFTHISRLGDVLRIGGFLVNPAEIEEAVIALSGATACQVVAVNAAGGSRPVAFVVLPAGRGLDETAIKAQLQLQIARYKVPIRIFSLESFPYTMSPNGMKVKRNELRNRAQAMLEKEAAL